MSRRPASITQADVARAIRAAKQAGATEIELQMGEKPKILIRLQPSRNPQPPLDDDTEIVL
jgi:2-iminoacetate synthase ThiH